MSNKRHRTRRDPRWAAVTRDGKVSYVYQARFRHPHPSPTAVPLLEQMTIAELRQMRAAADAIADL